MHKLIIFFSLLLIVQTSFAQSPEKMSYQAVIRDNGNQLLSNQNIAMRISILSGADISTAIAVYVEKQTAVTNASGTVSLEIGAGTIVTGIFANIDWSAGNYFIKMETDPTGGTNYNIIGTNQFLSTPYALYTKKAGNGLPSGGANGQILTLNGTTPVWRTPTAIKSAGTSTPTITSAGVTFNGVVNANGLSTTVSFEYGTTTSYGTTVTATTGPLTSFTDENMSSSLITGFTIGQVYHVRLVAQNIYGTFYGNDITFSYLYHGAAYLGGLVFSFDNSLQHGWICNNTELGGGIKSSYSNILRYFLDNARPNIQPSDPIISQDMYLPSLSQLQLMYSNLHVQSLGGFQNDVYSSSNLIYFNSGVFWYNLNFNNGTTSSNSSQTGDLNYFRGVWQF
jgi:hypothetical protein